MQLNQNEDNVNEYCRELFRVKKAQPNSTLVRGHATFFGVGCFVYRNGQTGHLCQMFSVDRPFIEVVDRLTENKKNQKKRL